MRPGPADFLTTALSSLSGEAELRPKRYTFNASEFLVDGDNVFAVSVHQKSVTSSDLIFDLNMRGNKLQVTCRLELRMLCTALQLLACSPAWSRSSWTSAVPGGTSIGRSRSRSRSRSQRLRRRCW